MATPPIPDSPVALFLDVDGTLLELAETPDAVRVTDSLKTLLHALVINLDGALALVSGRSVRMLDTLFAPYRFTAAGIHGCERRDPDGTAHQPTIDSAAFTRARDHLSDWSDAHPGTLLEDKGYALALHYRRAPQWAAEAHQSALDALSQLGGDYGLIRGKFVEELRPTGFTKGTAITTFMGMAPFAGRTAIFIGDDVTDEAGFAAVNQLDGVSIRVGGALPSSARYRLGNVGAVIDWLHLLSSHSALH